MKVGYIRVSSKGQNVARQRKSLEEYGCEQIFVDKKTGKNLERDQYKNMKKFIRKNDTIVFAEFDRLGRNKKEIDQEWNDLINRGCDIVVLDMPILNTTNYTDDFQKLLLNLAKEILSYQAEQERLKILERQRQGISIAKDEGKFTGRSSDLYRPDSPLPKYRNGYNRMAELLKMNIPVSHIAEDVGVSRNTVYKVKEEIERNSNQI